MTKKRRLSYFLSLSPLVLLLAFINCANQLPFPMPSGEVWKEIAQDLIPASTPSDAPLPAPYLVP